MAKDPMYDAARDYPGLTFDDTLAICDPVTFSQLMNYSHSAPTGVYDGKVWKGGRGHGDEKTWWLGSYESAPDKPGYSVRKYRPLEVIE